MTTLPNRGEFHYLCADYFDLTTLENQKDVVQLLMQFAMPLVYELDCGPQDLIALEASMFPAARVAAGFYEVPEARFEAVFTYLQHLKTNMQTFLDLCSVEGKAVCPAFVSAPSLYDALLVINELANLLHHAEQVSVSPSYLEERTYDCLALLHQVKPFQISADDNPIADAMQAISGL